MYPKHPQAFRNYLLLSLFFCLTSISVEAQRGNYNFGNFERKDFYFGIALGLNQSNFQIHKSAFFTENRAINSITSNQSPGMNLGIISNYKIQKYFDFRFTPSLVLGGQSISYTLSDPDQEDLNYDFEMTSVALPFHLRYKSAPYKDKRLFVIAGMKYSFNLSNDNNSRQQAELLKISATDYAFEIGAGIQFFLPFFIFSPEIKYSHGFGNIHIYDASKIESRALEKVVSRALTISLNFEG